MVGRNDPCPCGSGKKYKKCCLKRDEEARRAAAASPSPALELPAADVTPAPNLWTGAENRASEPEPEASAAGPEADPYYARWEEFEAEEDYEGRIALFLRTLDDGLMDADNAFEMLNVIYEDAVAHDDRERFEALVAQLRQRLPEVYARDAHFYAEWRIANALATGQLDALPALADELADTAGAQLDTVNRVFDQLAYHGQLSVLARAMRRAWPLVRDANRYFKWAVDEFAEQAMMMVLLDYLEHIETPDVAEMDALGVEFAIVPARPEAAAHFLAHITGQAGRRWTLADFDLAASRRRKGEPAPPATDGRLNLYDLTVEFL
ncbi:MAG: SEC-C metal-binding domain-containing protein, partial [Anaerolineae bacterium]